MKYIALLFLTITGISTAKKPLDHGNSVASNHHHFIPSPSHVDKDSMELKLNRFIHSLQDMGFNQVDGIKKRWYSDYPFDQHGFNNIMLEKRAVSKGPPYELSVDLIAYDYGTVTNAENTFSNIVKSKNTDMVFKDYNIILWYASYLLMVKGPCGMPKERWQIIHQKLMTAFDTNNNYFDCPCGKKCVRY